MSSIPSVRAFLAAVPLIFAAAVYAPAAAAADSGPTIAAAVADPHRPPADVARDAARKPAEMLAFAGVHRGETVLEIAPGGGYFTRLLSKIVGPGGHVWAAVPDPTSKFAEPAATAIAADPAYGNVTVVVLGGPQMAKVPPADLIWTSQNYHDMHLSALHLDVAAVDKQWLALLKPGGTLLVIDHVANAGAPVTATADALHRIDPAAAKAEILGAGFVLDGQSDALRNPADPHTAIVFDPSIRGHTDQFAYRFRKPG